MKLKFQVTEKHINLGQRAGVETCPIALALQDWLKFNEGVEGPVWATHNLVRMYGERQEYVFKPTPELAEAMDEYDRMGNMKPAIWEVEYAN